MELSALRDQYERFRKADTEILGISVDDVTTQGKFCDSLKLPFPLLADDGKAASKAYGVLYEKGDLCFSQRALFLVDKEGRLRFVNPKFDLQPPSFDALYRQVESLNAPKKGS